MLNKTGGYRAIVLGFIALSIVVSMVGARAGQGANAALRIASVDRTRLITEYKFTKEMDQTLQKQQQDTEFLLRTWAQNALLTPGDQTRLSDLALEQNNNPANFDPAKKAELEKLLKASSEFSADFTTLQSNQNMTPAQQTRLNVLNRAFSDTSARVEATKKTVTEELTKKDRDSQARIIKDMREATAQVAKAKGFSLVMPSETAFYCDNDITDAVLAAMNSNMNKK